jgi:hypothetical protein
MKISRCVFIVLLTALTCRDALAANNPPARQEQLDQSLRIDFWYGGWEADYTKTAYEMMFSYRNLGNLHLYGGFGDSKQVYYDRSKVYAGGYFFFQDSSYFKTFVSQKTYDYPVNPVTRTVNPDSSSYHREPKLEFELYHQFKENLRGRLSYEISRPTFFYDPNATVTNHKLGTELGMDTPIPGLHTKLYAAMLHDPDPNLTEIKGRNNSRTAMGTATTTAVVYKNTFLYGGAVEYVRDMWEVEVKLLQNRDLDNSYNYSLLNKLIYRLDDKRYLQFDYLHDVFSNQSNYAGKTADVHLISYYQQYSQRLKFGFGAKRIAVPGRTDDTAFVFLQANTGLFLK